MTARSSTAAPILAALLLIFIPLGLYLGGYYGLGEYSEHIAITGGEPMSIRVYGAQWQCVVFIPAACIEGAIHGRQVSLGYTGNRSRQQTCGPGRN